MEHTLALTLEYQGSGYHGFQVQPQVPTVQGELERALEALVGTHVDTRGASRTDAGAHARARSSPSRSRPPTPPRRWCGA